MKSICCIKSSEAINVKMMNVKYSATSLEKAKNKNKKAKNKNKS